ncbi:hypothetical protein PaG_02140 [Moesziomyces aphidis]|jgi:hypothetical protein|uniref:Uncharacterized protein n=1 Tax=Moesziomyces aphidis TaxID=84754 RepID=W3VSQ5_MOEAP|nr:hypothetical protein PaG_02140 [Moesziomyces aphidis]
MQPSLIHPFAIKALQRAQEALGRKVLSCGSGDSRVAARENLHAGPQLHVTENRTALRRETLLFFEPRGMQELRIKSAPRRCHTSHRQTSKLPEDGKTARHVSAFARPQRSHKAASINTFDKLPADVLPADRHSA